MYMENFRFIGFVPVEKYLKYLKRYYGKKERFLNLGNEKVNINQKHKINYLKRISKKNEKLFQIFVKYLCLTT